VVDLQNGEMHFTGKSYPTCNQEKRLLRVSDLNSHFISLGGEKTMVLGCHDLTMFNPRANAKALGWRLKTLREFKKLARHNAPTLVLHHPHTTVKQKTWLNAWNELRRELPMVRSYVGTGCYSFRDENRDSLNDVLEATKSPDAVDIVVSMARP